MMLSQIQFPEPNRHILTFFHRILLCRITYWAPLEMLLSSSNSIRFSLTYTTCHLLRPNATRLPSEACLWFPSPCERGVHPRPQTVQVNRTLPRREQSTLLRACYKTGRSRHRLPTHALLGFLADAFTRSKDLCPKTRSVFARTSRIFLFLVARFASLDLQAWGFSLYLGRVLLYEAFEHCFVYSPAFGEEERTCLFRCENQVCLDL
jgi:hypothetical protein